MKVQQRGSVIFDLLLVLILLGVLASWIYGSAAASSELSQLRSKVNEQLVLETSRTVTGDGDLARGPAVTNGSAAANSVENTPAWMWFTAAVGLMVVFLSLLLFGWYRRIRGDHR